MKKSTVFIALILNIVANGQTAETLVDENKLWSNLWQTASGGSPHHVMISTYVKFSGDTIIDSESYKRVLQSIDENQVDYAVIGYLREEQDKKVYYRNKGEVSSRLLYDFGAEVGDSINTGELILVVEAIDSVLINGGYRQKILLSHEGQIGEQWIAGIGSSCGILASGYFTITGGKYDLLCFYENDVLIYSNPEFEDCYYNTVSTGEIELNSLSVEVIPNPVISSSTMRIDGNFSHDLIIEIYTIEGVKIKTLRPDKSSFLLSRKDYLPGIYIYRLTRKNAEFISGKFIVK